MFSSGEVIECNNYVDTLTIAPLITTLFAVKFFVTFIFCNFNPKSHKFMSQKGLTFYVSTIISVAKIAIMLERAKINVAKNI